MSVYYHKLMWFHPHGWMDQGFNFFASRIALLIILILITFFLSCGVEIPAAAKELAISALCDFPPYSGHNICRDVEVTEVYQEHITGGQLKEDFHSCCWMELSYVDYTGHSGFASVWVAAEPDIGDFQVLEGPILSVPCFKKLD